MAKLFVSYSRKDSIPSRIIILALKEMGHDVWVDWEDIPPASDWLEQIFHGIEGADAFIFMVSPDSIISEVCTQEVKHAAKNNRRIIPVVLRPVTPQDTNEIVRKLNWIFLSEADDFTKGLERVKTAIELDFDWVEEHNRLQSRALEWDRQKDASLLLRGRDLRLAKNSILAAEAKKKDPLPTDLQKIYIRHSNNNQWRLWVGAGLTLVVMLALALLTYTSITQSIRANMQAAEANKQAIEANKQRSLAEVREREAAENARKARQAQQDAETARAAAENAKAEAENQRNYAAAQRSVARAQIYQVSPDKLYISTLLAIGAWNANPSDEAQEILRENISLLPIPLHQMANAGAINALELNDAGDLFVTAGADGTTCAWQTATGEQVYCVDSNGSVNDVAFIPKKNIVIAGDEAGLVQFINLDTKSVDLSFSFSSAIEDVNVSKDGKFAAVTNDSGKIDIIDLTKRQKAGTELDGRNTKVAVFSPNEFKLASGSSDGVISIWDLTTNNEPLKTRKHNGDILALAFSPDGKTLVTGGADGAAVATEVKTGKELFRCLNSGQVNDIAFAPNGSWFVTVSNDRSIRVWDSTTGDQIMAVSQNNIVRTVKVSANGQWIATTGDDKTVRVWSALTGTELYEIPLKGRGLALGFSKDGKYLVGGDQNGYVNIWDISGIFAPINSIQFRGNTTSALFSPSGAWAAITEDKRIWLLKPNSMLKTTKLLDNPYGKSFSVSRKAVFSAGDNRLGVLTAGNEIVLYNVKSNSAKTIRLKHPAQAFVFSPDERQVLVGTTTGELEVWNTVNGQFQTSSTVAGRIVGLIATSKYLIVATEDQIHILDINTFAEVDQVDPKGTPDLLAISPDGSALAAGNANGQILIWKLANDKFTSPRILNRANVASMSFSPANDRLAVGTVDHIFIYDLANLEEVVRIPVTGTVNSVAYSPDSSTLMSATLKFVQLWDVASLEKARITRAGIVQTACNHVAENLSPDQWNVLFENEPYTLLCPDLPAP
jgi:WD40 repeat protein